MSLDTAYFSNLPPNTISSELQRARDLALALITPAACRQPIKSKIITWSLVTLFKASLSTFKSNTPSLHSDSSVEACNRLSSVDICPLESQTIKHCSQLRWPPCAVVVVSVGASRMLLLWSANPVTELWTPSVPWTTSEVVHSLVLMQLPCWFRCWFLFSKFARKLSIREDVVGLAAYALLYYYVDICWGNNHYCYCCCYKDSNRSPVHNHYDQ